MDTKFLFTAGEGLVEFATNFTKCMNFDDYRGLVDKLQNDLDNEEKKLEAIKQIANFEKIYEPIWNESVPVPKEKLIDIISTEENAQRTVQGLKEYLAKSKAKMANDTLKDFAKARCLLIISETVFLIDTWNQIKNAENILNDSKLFDEIDKNIELIKQRLDKLRIEIENLSKEDSDIIRNRCLFLANNLMMNYTKTFKDLSAIKLKDTMHELNLINKSSKRSSVLNGIQTISAFTNVIHLYRNLSAWNKFFGVCIALGHSLITTAHIRNVIITDAKIKELQAQLEYFEMKETQLEVIRIRLEQACSVLHSADIIDDASNNLLALE